MSDLVTGVAARSGFKVFRAVGTNVPSVTTHGAEVIHIDDRGGGRAHEGVLELRRAGDEVDEHVGGRGVDCRPVVRC